MTDTPHTPEHLTPEQVDELISAELDDDFAAAATDLGLTPVTARALLDASPGARERATTMTAARDALRAPIEIDERLAARLRAKAINAASATRDELRARHGRRDRKLVLVTSGIAAAMVGALAIGASVHGANDSKAGVAASPRTPAAVTSPSAQKSVVDSGVDASHNTASDQFNVRATSLPTAASIGSFSTSAALANRLATSALPPSRLSLAAPDRAVQISPEQSDTASALGKTRTIPSARPADPCTAIEELLAGSTTAALYGTATVAGKPVLIRVFTRGARRLVLVLTPSCRLVESLQR